MTNEATSEADKLFREAISLAAPWELPEAPELFERAVAAWSKDVELGGFEVDGVDGPQDAFQVILEWYRPAPGLSSEHFKAICEAVLKSDWKATISSVFPDSVFVPTLMLIKNGNAELWDLIRGDLPEAMAKINDAAIGKTRYLAKVAFLCELAGDDELASQVFAAVKHRLANDQNCLCGTPGCSMGVGEWLSRYGI